MLPCVLGWHMRLQCALARSLYIGSSYSITRSSASLHRPDTSLVSIASSSTFAEPLDAQTSFSRTPAESLAKTRQISHRKRATRDVSFASLINQSCIIAFHILADALAAARVLQMLLDGCFIWLRHTSHTKDCPLQYICPSQTHFPQSTNPPPHTPKSSPHDTHIYLEKSALRTFRFDGSVMK